MNKNSTNCEMCNVSSEVAPLVLMPNYFIFGKRINILAHWGKLFCCDCLHDTLIVLGGEENEEK